MMTADRLTGLAWLGLGLIGLVAGLSQRRGRDYYPANLLLGLCLGSPGVFWLFWWAFFAGDVAALRDWSERTHASLWLYAGEIALALYACWLVWHVNTGRAGSSTDLAGHLGPPSPEMVEEALVILNRADRHDLLDALTVRWLEEDMGVRQSAATAARRRGIK